MDPVDVSPAIARAALASLERVLRLAHAGERAAAYAYRGHARSVRDPDERTAIERIERDEWEHRAGLAAMMIGLGIRPSPVRELMMAAIGRVLSVLCHVSGWYLPMYGAGWIERRNVDEYVHAARWARVAGHEALVGEFVHMAEIEWDHEQYFRGRVLARPGRRWLRMWPALPPRASLHDSLPATRVVDSAA